jgi:hypothetical protein
MPSAVEELREVAAAEVGERVSARDTPCVIRGLVADWPLVAAARRSSAEARAYLAGFDAGLPLQAQVAPPEARGRFFYDAELTGFNFRPERVTLSAVLDTLARLEQAEAAPAVYVGSTTLSTYLPGLAEANPMPGLPAQALASIWLGNRSRIAAHHDVPDNLACVAAGRRRFTLFAPEQVENLYVGPLDFTPAGQAISLVDFEAPDFERFPRFAQALDAALVAELAPGDALFIPGLWWHHVEGLEPFNVLVNYWWRQAPDWRDPPMNVLMHALLGLRGLPERELAGWQALFRHFVFEADAETVAHIPAHARGVLGPLDRGRAAELRELLRQRLQK